jgi:hypothetical protein
MKIGQCKCLILLAITMAFLMGASYLYLSNTSAEQPKAIPSLSATPPAVLQPIAKAPGAPPPTEKLLGLPTFSQGAYAPSPVAQKPAKNERYHTPRHEVPPSVLRQEGGETCASATAISALPYNATGYTCDNVDDYEETGVFSCPYSSNSPDVVYSYTPSANEVINIDMYGSSYDTKIWVYENVCQTANLVACNDDYYPDYVSAIFNLALTAGNTYYIVVDGYGGACGDYVILVEEAVACDVVCPPGGILEGEPDCGTDYVDMYNGGCNSSPYVFQTINCNTTICGKSGTYLYGGGNYRDTDWFRVVITSPTTLTWKAVGEFPILIFIIDAGSEDCIDYSVLGSMTADMCDTAVLTMDVQPGVYWLWVGPSVFDSYPCPLDYVAILDCQVATTGACCNNDSPYDCQVLTPTDCGNLPNHTFKGLGTNCGPPNPCLPAPSNDDCTGAIEVFPPQTVSGTTIGATIDCPGVLDWPAVWYKIVLTENCSHIFVDFCPMTFDLYTVGAVIFNECPPDCPNYILYSEGAFVTCPNSTYNAQLRYKNLPAGTYWIPIYVMDYSNNEYMDFSVSFSVEACAPPPPNDDCANATPVGDVTDLAFTTESATFDGPGACQYAPNIWYCYTATCDGNAHVDLCGSSYDTKLAAYEGCTCWGTMLACNDDACGGTLQSEVSFPVVQGNQYLIEVGGYGSATGSGDLSITCSLPSSNDECTGAPIINTFPQTVYGTTIGAGVDCPGVLDWNAVWYRFDVPYTCNNVDVNFCETNNNISTVGIVLYGECPPDCPNYMVSSGYQWLTCPNSYSNPEVWWNNLPGPASYWFPVYVGTAMDFGFTVSVEECVPCTAVVCPPGAMLEGEPICYDGYIDNYNGGCNSSPYIWQDITCNTWVCGTSGVYNANYNRDTDWFRVEVSEGTLTWKVVAEFPVLIFIMDAGSENCSDYTTLGYTLADPCDTAVLSFYVPAGVYWLWVGPSDWGNYPCGVEYVAKVECVGLGPQIAVTPTSFDKVLEPGRETDDTLRISNVGSENLDFQISHSANTWLSFAPGSGTIPPSTTQPVNVHFDATGLVVGDYYDNLVIASNSAKQLNDTVIVPVHLLVEYPPDIDVTSPLSMGVIPGCTMGTALRVNNLGDGELRFEASIRQNPLKADVLLVDDDNSINYPADFTDVQSYFTDALTANGYSYTVFEVNSIGGNGPDAATMSAYPVVIWFTGESWQLNQTLTSTDEANLATYLNGGGNLFLSAMDYFYDRYPAAGSFSPGQFPYDYLGVTYVSQDVWYIGSPSTGHCDGMAGSVANGMSFDLWDPYTAKGLGSRGYVIGPDDGLFIDELTHNGTDVFQMTDPTPTGIAACQYEGGGFKTVFTTVDFAGLLDNRSAKNEFMASVMNWFLGAGCPFTLTPEADTVPPESYVDLALTFDGSVFQTCVEETLTCYVRITSNDPDEPQVTVEVDMWSGRGDVYIPNCWIDLGDVVYLINYVYKAGPPPSVICMGDCNRDGFVDVQDVMYLWHYLYVNDYPPPLSAPTMTKPGTMK